VQCVLSLLAVVLSIYCIEDDRPRRDSFGAALLG